MSEKLIGEPPKEEEIDFPVVEVVCTHCLKIRELWKTEGKIGPIESGIVYPLSKYTEEILRRAPRTSEEISALQSNLPPEKRNINGILFTHHNTVRDGWQGHHKFIVNLDGKEVGIIRVSTSTASVFQAH
jgi:hypothetical protein